MSKALRLLDSLLYFLSGLSPRNRRKIVFGAWHGRKFADNPKYLLLFLAAHHRGLDLVWIGRREMAEALPRGIPVRFVRYGSLASWYENLTAGFCFFTHSIFDVSRCNILRGATAVYLGHGVALKHMGTLSVPLPSRVLEVLRSLVRRAECYDYFVTSSRSHGDKMLKEYAINGATEAKLLQTGQPRIDFIIHGQRGPEERRSREEVELLCGKAGAKRIITYLPTFRDRRQRSFSFARLKPEDAGRLQALLERHGAIIVEKGHAAETRHDGGGGVAPNRVFVLTDAEAVDTQELLLASDLLITDYSGCFLDFLLLDRPVLHYVYDREYYTRDDRGLYYDLDEVAAGPVVEQFSDLCVAMEQELLNPARNRELRQGVRGRLMSYETGEACEQIVNLVLERGPAFREVLREAGNQRGKWNILTP